MSQHIKDPCYGIYYLIGKEQRFPPGELADSPFTAPASIMSEILADLGSEQLDKPIHPDFTNLQQRHPRLGSLLCHAIGTWHMAELCLEFKRITYRHPLADDETSLAERLKYGMGLWDTLAEEFALAAFFQVILSQESSIGHDERGRESESREQVKDAIERHLNRSETYRNYNKDTNRILTDVIAYWISGKGAPPLLAAPEKPYADKKVASAIPNRITRVRRFYFDPVGPLNLRHLDLVARMYRSTSSEPIDSKKEAQEFSRDLRSFLKRIRIAERMAHGAEHLLPSDDFWDMRTPYDIPLSEDYPTYHYILPFVKGMLEIKRSAGGTKTISKKKGSHSIFQSFGSEPKGGKGREGFLRLSFPEYTSVNANAKAFARYIRQVLSPDKTAPAPEAEDVYTD